MKNSKEYSQKVYKLYRSLKRKHPKAKKVIYDEPVDALIYAIISERMSEKAAHSAMKKFTDYFFDWNDLRVSRPEEIVELLCGDTTVTRDITLAAFQNEATFNAAVVTYGKCTLTWNFKALPTRDSFNSTTAPQAGAWCFAGTLNASPTTARVLDTAATAASSNATTLTVEESI